MRIEQLEALIFREAAASHENRVPELRNLVSRIKHFTVLAKEDPADDRVHVDSNHVFVFCASEPMPVLSASGLRSISETAGRVKTVALGIVTERVLQVKVGEANA